MLLLVLLIAAVSASSFRCPIDGKKYTKYVRGQTVKACPSDSIDLDNGKCRDPRTGRYVAVSIIKSFASSHLRPSSFERVTNRDYFILERKQAVKIL